MIQKIQAYVSFVGQFDPQAIYQSMPRGKSLAALEKAYNLPSELTRTAQEIDEAAEKEAEVSTNGTSSNARTDGIR